MKLKLAGALLAATCTVMATAPHDRLRGLCGAELKQAVRDCHRPQWLYDSPSAIWPAIRLIDTGSDGMIADPFSTARYRPDGNPSDPVCGMGHNAIAPPLWWSCSPAMADSIGRDLHNVVPCNFDVTANKSHYPPLPRLDEIFYDNGTWQAGIAVYGGAAVNAYTPPPGFRGDIARTIMYTVAVYDPGHWDMIMSRMLHDERYPALDPEFGSILLQWHNDDPVSEREAARNQAIAGIQGNTNPFVDIPELAAHIWGEHKSEPWGAGLPDQLRSDYGPDETIWLESPYIPSEASWSIGGIPVDTRSVEASALGPGEHELRYTTPAVRGKLKIRISS